MMKFGKSSSANVTTSEAPVSDLRGFLGEGTHINGEVTFKDILRVDGQISGKIISESGTLLVGESGHVKASVEAANVSVSGIIEGTVTAKNKVEIHPTGKILGDVYTTAFIIQHGAVFEGKSQMTGRADSTSKTPAKTPPAEKEINSAVKQS